jgi:SAM-dependent methyltransferase
MPDEPSTAPLHPHQAAERELRERDSARYDGFFPSWRVRAETEAVLRTIHRLRGSDSGTLVDLGCGTGRIALAAAPSFARVVGIDFSPSSIDVARRKVRPEDAGRVELRVGNALETGLPEGIADAVTCAQLLQHMPDEAHRDRFLEEVRRLLRPGGFVVLTCYGLNARHRLRGAREGSEGGLYYFRHSPRALRARLRRWFPDAQTRAFVGLPDRLPWPRLDRLLSRVPGYGPSSGAQGRRGDASGQRAARRRRPIGLSSDLLRPQGGSARAR